VSGALNNLGHAGGAFGVARVIANQGEERIGETDGFVWRRVTTPRYISMAFELRYYFRLRDTNVVS